MLKKQNYIMFRPDQKKINNPPHICILDNETNKGVLLGQKDCMKYLGIEIDEILS